MEVEAATNKGKENERIIKVEFEFVEDLDKMLEGYPPEVVFAHARSSMVIALQSAIRGWMTGDEPKTDEEISTLIGEWEVPTGQRKGRPLIERVEEQLDKLSAEDKAALLARLTA